MNKNFDRLTITAALPYANGPLHVGHLAGAYLPADIYVKYQKLNNKDVLFICGSDEHGAAITIKAKKENISIKELIDKYHFLMKETFEKFNIDFDIYSRTSNLIHHDLSKEFFLKFYEKNLLEEKSTLQYYDVEANMFLADRYIIGTCPKCNYDNAYGDQCEKCGSTLSPEDLIEPISAITKTKPILKETLHWFLPLNKWQTWLENYIESHNEWKNNVLGQCKSWLKQGLESRSITRDLEWGVNVPIDNVNGKVLYVWFDAPIGYISASKEWAKLLKKDDEWKKYWLKEESQNKTKLIHFIGKDNIVFHSIIFPVILKEHGDYILADNVPANEFLNLENKKISTSRNWAIWLHEYAENYPDKIDILRYYITSILPENSDSNFSWIDFVNKNNSDLCGVLGNYINRVFSLIHKYYDGIIPNSKIANEDIEIYDKVKNLILDIGNNIENYKFKSSLELVISIARIGNIFLQQTEPWKLYENNENRVKEILFLNIQIISILSTAIQPFMPTTASKIENMLNKKSYNWNIIISESILIESGHKINLPHILFI